MRNVDSTALGGGEGVWVVIAIPCGDCGGEGCVDSGGVTPWGEGINIKCGRCDGSGIDPDSPLITPAEVRLMNGEAWMMCSDCGAKLYSFDGAQDGSKKCPYMDGGRCEPR